VYIKHPAWGTVNLTLASEPHMRRAWALFSELPTIEEWWESRPRVGNRLREELAGNAVLQAHSKEEIDALKQREQELLDRLESKE
jgi:hypothetical protein